MISKMRRMTGRGSKLYCPLIHIILKYILCLGHSFSCSSIPSASSDIFALGLVITAAIFGGSGDLFDLRKSRVNMLSSCSVKALFWAIGSAMWAQIPINLIVRSQTKPSEGWGEMIELMTPRLPGN